MHDHGADYPETHQCEARVSRPLQCLLAPYSHVIVCFVGRKTRTHHGLYQVDLRPPLAPLAYSKEWPRLRPCRRQDSSARWGPSKTSRGKYIPNNNNNSSSSSSSSNRINRHKLNRNRHPDSPPLRTLRHPLRNSNKCKLSKTNNYHRNKRRSSREQRLPS